MLMLVTEQNVSIKLAGFNRITAWHPSMFLVLLYLVRFSLVNQWILELVCVYIVIMDTNSV